jgi:hypothetical protein
LCGAKFIDEDFEKELIRRIGPEGWETLPLESKTALRQHWEDGIKRGFRGGRQQWPLPRYIFDGLGNNQNRSISILSADTVRSIFDPTVVKIENLVRSQFELVREKTKPPSKVLITKPLLALSFSFLFASFTLILALVHIN